MLAFVFGFAALSLSFHWQHSRVQRTGSWSFQKSLAETKGESTTDTADLKMTEDALAEDTAALEDITQDCQAKADDFEASTKSRSEELAVLAQAQKMISEKTGGAESFSNLVSVPVRAFVARRFGQVRGCQED